MPVEFRMETKANNVLENTRSADWERELVTHYTGIGTEVRENYRDGYPNCSKGGRLGRRRPWMQLFRNGRIFVAEKG